MEKPICEECESHKDWLGRPRPKTYIVHKVGPQSFGEYWDYDGNYHPSYPQMEFRCSEGHHWYVKIISVPVEPQWNIDVNQ